MRTQIHPSTHQCVCMGNVSKLFEDDRMHQAWQAMYLCQSIISMQTWRSGFFKQNFNRIKKRYWKSILSPEHIILKKILHNRVYSGCGGTPFNICKSHSFGRTAIHGESRTGKTGRSFPAGATSVIDKGIISYKKGAGKLELLLRHVPADLHIRRWARTNLIHGCIGRSG